MFGVGHSKGTFSLQSDNLFVTCRGGHNTTLIGSEAVLLKQTQTKNPDPVKLPEE